MFKNKFIRQFFFQHVSMHLIPIFIILIILSIHTFNLLEDTATQKIENENEQILERFKHSNEMIFQEQDTLNLTIIASAFQFTQLREYLSVDYPSPSILKELAELKTFIDSPAIGREYIDSIYIYVENDNKRFISSSQGGIVDQTNFPDAYWLDHYKDKMDSQDVWIERRYAYMYGIMGELEVKPVISLFRTVPLKDDSLAVMVLNIKEEYIVNSMKNFQNDAEQLFLITDNEQSLLTSSFYAPTTVLHDIITKNNLDIIHIDGIDYIIQKVYSKKYHLNYTLLTPEKNLYKSIHQYKKTLLLVTIVALIIGLFFSLIQTMNITKFLLSITNLLNQAKNLKARDLKTPTHVSENIYSYISYQLLKNFIKRDYLETKLTSMRYEKKAAELSMLQAQLNPHFLYNTLESINWRATALIGQYNVVNEMIEHLSNILRYALEEPGNVVPFEMEKAYSDSYLAIQKIRFGQVFDVIWDIDPTVYDRKILKLLFQPILENILFHAFNNGELQGTIKIKVKCTDTNTEIVIIDNGKGMSKETLNNLKHRLLFEQITSKHIGVLNTHMRLKIVYENQFGFKILSKENWGTVFSINIPNEQQL